MTRNLRVAVITDAVYPWHKGGKEVRYRELLRRLPDHDLDVTVYSMKWWDEDVPGRVKYVALCNQQTMYRNGRRSIRQGLVFAISCVKLVAERFDTIEADHMPYLQIFPLRIIATIRRTPFVVTWHEVWGDEYWRTYIGGPAGRIGAVLERWAARMPDHIVAVSPTTATRLMALGVAPERVTVLMSGIDLVGLDEAATRSDAASLVFVGRLLDHKRVDVAIGVVAALAERGVVAHLTIVGEGPELESLVALSVALGVQEHVTFAGVCEEAEEVWSHVKSASVFVFPSEREGFGIAVAEALAVGTAVVCSDHLDNSSSALVEHGVTGSVVRAGDVDAFADAVQFWLELSRDRIVAASDFLDRHQHLSWDSLASGYAELLTSGRAT